MQTSCQRAALREPQHVIVQLPNWFQLVGVSPPVVSIVTRDAKRELSDIESKVRCIQGMLDAVDDEFMAMDAEMDSPEMVEMKHWCQH